MSPIGKRAKRENSKFSTPSSVLSNKRTLKATRKGMMILPHKGETPEPFSPDMA
jgi:hypothetical protein